MAIVDVARVALALNLHVRRVQYLVKEGMPREARGKYDAVKCMCWYIRYLQILIEKKSTPRAHQVGESAERVRLLRAKADIAELQLARVRSQLVTVADVDAFHNELVDTTTKFMMTIPPRVASELVGETSRIMIQAKIEKAIDEVLSALAKGPTNRRLYMAEGS
jgi:phage terminase Nu1 subunit (DNA packaging protein)